MARVDEIMKVRCILVVLLGMSAALPAHAKVSAAIAGQCHTLAFEAHPDWLPNIKATAYLRHSYYRLCISRHGIMDQELYNKKYGG